MLKRVIPGVLIVIGVLAIGAFVATRGNATQASDTQPAPPAQTAPSQEVPENTGDSADSPEAKMFPFVGVALGLISDDELAEQGLDNGVLVAQVVEGSPADGILLDGDIITAINGDAVSSPGDVVETVHDSAPNEVMTFSVVRDGESLDVDVTLGEREVEVRIFRSESNFIMPSLPMLGQFGGMTMDKIIKAEVRIETDEGIKTFRAASGTVSKVDTDAGTFDLTLKDGSETIPYKIGDDTQVMVQHEGDLSGLNAEDTAFVVEVEDDAGERTVMMVAQGTNLGQHHRFERFHDRDFSDGPGLRFFHEGAGRLGIPDELHERLRRFMAPSSFEGDFEGRLFDMEKFFDNLPEGAEEYFESLPFGPGSIEIEKEIILEGSSL